MATIITANTTISPSADGWTIVVGSPTSDGVKWLCPVSQLAFYKTAFTFNGTKEYELNVSLKVCKTTASYHGFGFYNNTKSRWLNLGCRWETANVNWISNWSYGTAVNSSVASSTAGVVIASKIIIRTNGTVEYYVNGTFLTSTANAVVNGDVVQVRYNRYTSPSTTEEIYSLTLDENVGSAPSNNFFPFLIAHS